MRLLHFQRLFSNRGCFTRDAFASGHTIPRRRSFWKILDNMSHLTSTEETIEDGEAVILVMHMQCERDNLSPV